MSLVKMAKHWKSSNNKRVIKLFRKHFFVFKAMLGTLESWKENEKLLTRHILLFFGKTQLKKKKEKKVTS